MKVFCATMIHESNSFSPIPTSLRNFAEDVLYRPSTGEGSHHLGTVLAEVDLVDLMTTRGHEPIVGLIANAEPSMPLGGGVYETLRDEIIQNLEQALPVDAVFLFLHGAQMAEKFPDCESDLISRVRKIVGPDIPIGVEFDLHCNIGAQSLEDADILLACLEYPHTDFRIRADQVMDILERMAAGKCRPATAYAPIPMLGLFRPSEQPMRGFVDKLKDMEGRDNILAISLAHCFAAGDGPDTHAGVVVVTNDDQEQADRLAGDIAKEFWHQREAFSVQLTPLKEALEQAGKVNRGPLVIADCTDNPGGGAAGDSTEILSGLLAAGIGNAAIAMIWDPVAVETVIKAGVGASLPLRFGGKAGPGSGSPVDADVRVLAVNKTARQHAQGARVALGPAVAVETAGIKIVLNSIRQQTFSPECFTELGIDPAAHRVLVVKSSQHFRETFSDMAEQIIYADGTGTVTGDFCSRDYRNLTRPIWPLDPLPFDAFGRTWT
ncbi:M81 family metallopeptidase [Emcibacter nanhaiensis]|uniref:Microcystinase C n=1 Tax=Emcibacter nanhaiensis TaxID=1505037 RepID=A0A501PGS8_9PROT|nr:M81 family metallopeptidase [Emcibacter nanhaiensis]TPD59288.1 M81 family metallopeptidase [Emcibacter nanhaiensis]